MGFFAFWKAVDVPLVFDIILIDGGFRRTAGTKVGN
jgi:hypothetical protein